MSTKINIYQKIKDAQNIAICVNDDDQSLSVGIAWAMFVKERFKKEPNVVYLGDISKIDLNFSDFWTIKDTLSNKSVKIKIDHKNTDVSAIEWERTDNDEFILNLKSVNKSFNLNRIQTEIIGVDYDLIICVGINDIKTKKDFYVKNKVDLQNAFIINFDNDKSNKMYGNFNLVDKNVDNLISFVLKIFAKWDYAPSQKISEVLLTSLKNNNTELDLQSNQTDMLNETDLQTNATGSARAS